MTVKTRFHIAVQIVALAAQTLIPGLPLSAEARAWVVPIISFIQGALAIIALFSESPNNGGNPSSGSKFPPLSGGAAVTVLVWACTALSLAWGWL